MLSRARYTVALALGLALAGPATTFAGVAAPCDDAIVDSVLDQVGAPDDGRVRASACAPIGGPHGLVAVAVAFERVGYDWRSSPDLPVHVAWYDPRVERVVASGRADIGEDAATQVDSDSLTWEAVPGLGRDAAALVVNDSILTWAMDGDTGPTWALFVADGPRLQAVVGPAMLSYARCSRSCRDADESERHTRTLSLAPARGSVPHHGLRDLVATLRDSTRRAPTRQQLHFDGHRYVPEVDRLVAP